MLTNNNLTELGDIDPLADCTKLEYLTLMGNPLTHKPNYRLYVIYKLKSVRVLDYRRIRLSVRNFFYKTRSVFARLRSDFESRKEQNRYYTICRSARLQINSLKARREPTLALRSRSRNLCSKKKRQKLLQ